MSINSMSFSPLCFRIFFRFHRQTKPIYSYTIFNCQHQQKLDSIVYDVNMECVRKLDLINSTTAMNTEHQLPITFFQFSQHDPHTHTQHTTYTQNHSRIKCVAASLDHKTSNNRKLTFIISMTHSTFASVIFSCLQLCRVNSYKL